MNNKRLAKILPCRLDGKTVVISGATGGIGKELCRYVLHLGANLCMLDRNPARSNSLKSTLKQAFPHSEITNIIADLEDIDAVNSAISVMLNMPVDIIIFNAGIYNVPRHKTSIGYDNVFTVNCLMPYYITKKLLPVLKRQNGRVIIVGSVAHRYSKTKENSVDFCDVKSSELVYGNSKRSLMYGMYELFENSDINSNVSLAVCHPGITFTNITNHYPKLIFLIIKNPMKIIFMKPEKASLSIMKGCFENTKFAEWIGPNLFDVWGLPKKKKIKIDRNESKRVFTVLENITENLQKKD